MGRNLGGRVASVEGISLVTTLLGVFTNHRSAANVVADLTVVSSNTKPLLENPEGERNELSMSTIAANLAHYLTPIGLSPMHGLLITIEKAVPRSVNKLSERVVDFPRRFASFSR